jgi:hypothetical protein
VTQAPIDPTKIIDPTKLIERDFNIRKIKWSIYDVNHPNVKGTLRLTTIAASVAEVPSELLPSGVSSPQFAIIAQPIVGFKNEWNKGKSDPLPILPQEAEKLEKEDITSSVVTREEPFNEYVIGGNPPVLLRTKTVMISVIRFIDRYNLTGDPALLVNQNTGYSFEKLKPTQSIA